MTSAVSRESDRPDATPPPESSHRLLGRLLRAHVRPYAGRLALAALCMVVVAATTGANAWLLQPAVDEIFIARSETMLVLLPIVVLLVALFKGGAGYGEGVLMAGVGQRIIADTQKSMYAHLIRADLGYLHEIHTGKLLASFLYDANLLRDAVSRAINGMIKDGLTVIALVIVMFIQDWQLALATLFVFPLAGLAMRRLGRRVRKAATQTQAETGRLSQHLTETLESARLVKAYSMEARETARAGQAIERRLRQILKMVRTRAASRPVMEMLSGIAVAIAIFYGGWQAQAGNLSLGAFTSFLAAMLMAYQPVKSLATLNNALQEGLSAAQRIFAVLDVEPEIREQPGAADLEFQAGEIRFDQVNFAYGTGVPALNGIDVTIPAGAMVALVGPSGAGKSSLLNLIPRFYDVGSGAVLIDGQDVRAVSLASLRGVIALVSQEARLFDDTVLVNIAYGRSGVGHEEIVEAARAADADGFIRALPEGYETVIGENGVKLSGGQRQRLAIARAILRNAPILLLDEATSALDSEAERQVQAALGRLMQGRTTLVIAHRLSTVMAADVILVMDAGRIVEVRYAHRAGRPRRRLCPPACPAVRRGTGGRKPRPHRRLIRRVLAQSHPRERRVPVPDRSVGCAVYGPGIGPARCSRYTAS